MALVNNIKGQTVEYQNIENFFSDNYYDIPDYQRRYSWQKDNIVSFLDSIMELFNVDDGETSNYLGSVLISKIEGEGNTFHILDGQQRMITIIITLVVLKEKIMEQKKILSTIRLDDQIVNDINMINNKYEEMLIKRTGRRRVKNQKKNVLKSFDSNDNKVINSLINDENIEELDKRLRIVKAYQIIHDLIDEQYKSYITATGKSSTYEEKVIFLIEYFESITKYTYILRTELNDVEDAFSIFEATNTTGLQLSPFDLINGFISNQLTKSCSDMQEEWITSITEYIARDINLTDYVFYWANSTEKSYSNRQLYSYIKGIFDYKNPEKIPKLLLDVFSKLDEYINGDSLSARHIKILGRKRLFSIYLTLQYLGYSETALEKFMMDMVKYSSIELNIKLSSPGIFQYKVKSIIESLHKVSTSDITFKELRKEKPNLLSEVNKDFNNYGETLFDPISNGTANNDQFYKSLLLLIVEDEQKSSTLKYETIDLEHIFPKNPHDDWFTKEPWKALEKNSEKRLLYTGKLGNMMLLNERLNKSISNGYIDVKKNKVLEDLENNKYDALKNSKWNLVDFDSFSPDYIDKRTKDIVSLISKRNIFDI